MPADCLHVTVPPTVADHLAEGRLRRAIEGIAGMAGAAVEVEQASGSDAPSAPSGADSTPIRHQGRVVGRVECDASTDLGRLPAAARNVAGILEHMVEREAAVADTAQALLACYAELNLFYGLLPALATKTDLHEIAGLLVDQAAQALRCRRVSLMAFDESNRTYRLLAARGLPEGVGEVVIPADESVVGQVDENDGLLLVQDIGDRPDLAAMSRGEYDTRAFAVIRVPLRAQGRALGVLSVTEREGGGEFDAHDGKVLEALSAVGATAILNCRLHAANERQMVGTIEALASAVDAKDHYTHNHSHRVAELCVATARELGAAAECMTLREIELAGLLHDIGKIGIPDRILGKSGALTPEEHQIVRGHVQVGAEIVGRVRGLERVAQAILHHHERYDGSGYLAGLRGEAIPIGSRLIAVADTFDCLTTDRPYHAGVSAQAALGEIARCSGADFDPAVAAAFGRVAVREGAAEA